MKSLFGFTLRLAIILAVAVWLADRPGTAHIVWHDYVIECSAAFLGLCALGVGIAIYLLFRLGHFIKFGPRNWRLRRRMKKMRVGHDYLAHGLNAIAGGNASEAGRHAVNARKLLGPTSATQLLQAQAAQLAGDHAAANEIFRSLAANSDTAVLGYRGLIMEARRAGDWAEVQDLVMKLHEVKPKTPWLHMIRFELLARQQNWADAHAALGLATSLRQMDAQNQKQNRAALFIATSQTDAARGHYDKALSAAEQAVKYRPDWLPAIINLARQQRTSGHARAATRTVEKNWAQHPHPQLAAIYRIRDDKSDDNALDAFRQTERLCRDNDTTPVSHRVLAEAALAAKIWGEARRHLLALVEANAATQAVYRMLAQLERRENGNEQAAMHWLMKAADAPAEPTWLCRSCGGAHAEWQATCNHCGSFNSLDWRSPGISHKPMAQDTTALLSHGWMN